MLAHVSGFVAALCVFAAATGQDVKAWTPEQALRRLSSKAPVELHEVNQLVGTLSSANPKVRLASLRFWGKRAGETYETIVEDGPNDTQTDVIDLADLCKRIVGAVDKAIDDSDPLIRREALRTLCMLEEPAEDAFLLRGRCGDGFYQSPPGQVWLVRIRRGDSLRKEMIALAGDRDPNVAYNALRSLSQEDLGPLHPTVRAFLGRREKLVRAIGLRLLSVAGDQEVFQWVGPLMDDPDEDVRDVAKQVFRRSLKDPSAAFAGRMSWSPNVREEIASMIGEGKASNREAMLRAMLQDPADKVRAAALTGLTPYGEDVKSPLSESEVRAFIRDRCADIRATALMELFQRKVPDIVVLLKTGLTDRNREVRQRAAWCCMHSFEPELTQAVVKAVELGIDDDWEICHYFSDPSNDKLLDGWLQSKNVRIRRTAALSLSPREEPERFVPRLYLIVDDPDEEVVGYAAAGLIGVPGEKAAAALRKIAGRSRGKQLADVFESIGMRKDRSLEDVVKAHVDSKDRVVRRAARSALRILAQSEDAG